MNLNDILNRLPAAIRGRFAAQNNLWWLNAAADAISAIEKASIGSGNIRRVQAFQMKSGFIPLPAVLRQVNFAWLNGEKVKGLREKNSQGFQMEPGAVTYERHDVRVRAISAFDAEIAFVNTPAIGDALPPVMSVTVTFDGSTKNGILRVDSGGDIPQTANALAGFAIWINGLQFHITASSYDSISGLTAFTVSENSSEDVTLLSGQTLEGYDDDCLAGAELHCTHDLIGIAGSIWQKPISTPGGWTVSNGFSIERAMPGRSWPDYRDGQILTSNLVLEGYRALARPVALTDELDLPEGSDNILEHYFRWKAEYDSDPSGPDARACEANYLSAMSEYSIAMSRTEGDSMPTAYNMPIRLNGGRW